MRIFFCGRISKKIPHKGSITDLSSLIQKWIVAEQETRDY